MFDVLNIKRQQCNNQMIGFDLLIVLIHKWKIDLFSLLVSTQLIRHLTNINTRLIYVDMSYTFNNLLLHLLFKKPISELKPVMCVGTMGA